MHHSSGSGRPEGELHGLRFLNEEWNESISNGESFTLEWNETIDVADAKLGVFRITFPPDEAPDYELVKDLTDYLEATTCKWTPEDLNDDLYALWLTTVSDGNQTWTISPPWKLRDPSRGRYQWLAPIGIPVLAILSVYAMSLMICFWYRRRKRLKRPPQRPRNPSTVAPPEEDDAAGRHPSVSSVDTAQTLSEPEYQKPGSVLIITHEGRDYALTGRENGRESPRGVWLENIQLDGFRFDRRRSDDDERTLNEHDGISRMPRRPEDMYVAPGTAI